MGILEGRRVLVLEDEALVAMLVEDTLREAGADVIGPVGTVAEAIPVIEQALRDAAGLDAAVVDMNLHGESALPVAELLAGHGIPFLVASGYGAGALKSETLGEVPTIGKPFDPDELVRALARLLPGAG